eukprot:jgi/Ulvmu1/5286/UM022_0080.1
MLAMALETDHARLEQWLDRQLSQLQAASPQQRYMSLASALLRTDLRLPETLQARQEMLALAKVLVHSGDSPPELLASALLNLGVAYSDMALHAQALVHCTDAVALAYRLHSHPSQSGAHETNAHTEETSALDLWQHGTRLLAELELKLYHKQHSKASLLRAQAHFEAAFPLLLGLRSHGTDDALQDDIIAYFEQRMDLALVVGECYAALGTEEASLAEAINSRLAQLEEQLQAARHEQDSASIQGSAAATLTMQPGLQGKVESTAGELKASVGRAQQYLDVAVSVLYLCEQHDNPDSGIDRSSSICERDGAGTHAPGFGMLQQRINECLYNAAVADILDREKAEAQAAAIGKLREVLSRSASNSGQGLPLGLEAQTLLLLGTVQAAMGRGEDAVDTYQQLVAVQKQRSCGKVTTRRRVSDAKFRLALALRSIGRLSQAAELLTTVRESVMRTPAQADILQAIEHEMTVTASACALRNLEQ